MRTPIKVYLCGSENNGWALDTDLALTRESLLALPDLVELSSLTDADVVHSVWEEPLFKIDQKDLAGKRVICHVCNDFMRLHENPGMIRAEDTVGLWIAMSQEAVSDLQSLGYPYEFIPYSVDIKAFYPIEDGEETGSNTSHGELRKKYRLAEDGFIISNFMRDSFAHDLNLPKDQKGTELLLEIGLGLQKKNIPVHFLLAGPRRHWIRARLREAGIAYTFIGEELSGDDIALNIQSVNTIADLYKASDVHLITSRWEGGPRSVLEAAATKTPILCTPVGTAPDILDAHCIYGSVEEALAKLTDHFKIKHLNDYVGTHRQKIEQSHTAATNGDLFRKLYSNLEKVKPYSVSPRWVEQPSPKPTLGQRVSSLVRSKLNISTEKKLCISLWHKFHKPPYGGGNQFMMALQGAMEKQGVKVVTNKLSRTVDAHVCNSCWFDYKKFENKATDFPIRMIHRIDGPVTLYRGEGSEEDELIFSLNKRFASATVFQSSYSFKKSYELGFRAISPVIIHNSVNSQIFNNQDRPQRNSSGKIRLVTSAWSDNPRKGGAFLKWLDTALDWDRYEYTFVGRVNETFENINHIPAVPSEELAEILRQHDIYVSVSLHEPCSNALLEALYCGLPALYRDDGGNPELVSFGGLPFVDEDDVLINLDRMAENLDSFKSLIQLRSIDDIASRYINLARQICSWQV